MMRLVFGICLVAIAMIAMLPGGPLQPERAVVAPVVEQHTASLDNNSNTNANAPQYAGNGVAEVVLRRAADRHFYADAQVNGTQVRFLVDSGATSVVLTRADAQAAGIGTQAGEFTASAQSANGVVKLKPIIIGRLAIGPVSATNVDAMVAENDLGISLLGQSFLTRVSKVEIADGEMRLR